LKNSTDPTSFDEYNEDTGRGYGYYVVIDHGNGIFSRYAHLQSLSHLKEGVSIKAGEIVGRLGDSGASRGGAHLHFGMWQGTLHNRAKFVPPQLGQYTSLTKFDENGNTRRYYPETAIYDPHGQLTAQEKTQYATTVITISNQGKTTSAKSTRGIFGSSKCKL